MKHISKVFQLLILTIVLFVSCKKENPIQLQPSILFSVDLDNQKFNIDYMKAYIAAYTPQGELLNYGSLSDSSKWDLKAEYNGSKIDILYYEVWRESSVNISHIKAVPVGETFTDPNWLVPDPLLNQYKPIIIKVEDFGNRDDNNTASNNFEKRAYKHIRGYAYPYGDIIWDKIENGFAYSGSLVDAHFENQGMELSLFERGTNTPYVHYLDIAENSVNSNDTITLMKSDFTPGELKSIQVNSLNNDFDNIFLYTYHSETNRKDLITSFENVDGNANEKIVRYIKSDIFPISYWKFDYNVTFAGNTTTYSIRSNKTIPSLIDIKELTGHSITKSGYQFNFTHSDNFPDKNLANSMINFSKARNDISFSYSLHFDGSESTGNTVFTPFEIPAELLTSYNGFSELNNDVEWEETSYSQVYTNISHNSPLDILKNNLTWKENNSSNNDYTYEVFSIKL